MIGYIYHFSKENTTPPQSHGNS